VDALKQIVERELALDRNDDLAIQYEAFCVQIERSGGDLRKIALQVLAAFGEHCDVAGIAREDATEAVPLGLVLPLRSLRNLVDRPRLHGSEWSGRFSHAALRLLPGVLDRFVDAGWSAIGRVTNESFHNPFQ